MRVAPVVVLGLLATPALAEGDANAVKGLLVDRCAECHAVPGYSETPPDTGIEAPGFQAIADDQTKYSDAHLRDSLSKPHWPMTGMILSPTDIDNILAYLETLRQE